MDRRVRRQAGRLQARADDSPALRPLMPLCYTVCIYILSSLKRCFARDSAARGVLSAPALVSIGPDC